MNKLYKCEFPGCNYTTHDRSLIEYHHIIPRSKNGSNKRVNRIWICSNCHKRIYIPGETHGQHSINGPDRIVLKGWLQSTMGKTLVYEDYNGNELFYMYMEA